MSRLGGLVLRKRIGLIGILLLMVMSVSLIGGCTLLSGKDELPGTGLSRKEVQEKLEKTGLEFKETDTYDLPTVEAIDTKLKIGVALMGPEEDLQLITYGWTLSEEAYAAQAIYLLLFMTTVAPDWKDGGTWVVENMDLAREGKSPSIVHGNLKFELSYKDSLYHLVIRGKQ